MFQKKEFEHQDSFDASESSSAHSNQQNIEEEKKDVVIEMKNSSNCKPLDLGHIFFNKKSLSHKAEMVHDSGRIQDQQPPFMINSFDGNKFPEFSISNRESSQQEPFR